MSGFGYMAVGLANGMAKGLVNYNKGQDDELKYQELMNRKKQEEQSFNQNQKISEEQLKQLQIQTRAMQDGILKTAVDATKKNFANRFEKFVDTYTKYQGNLAYIDETTGEKTYNIPEELQDGVKDINNLVVHDPASSDWIAHYLEPKFHTLENPIVNVSYDPHSDQLIMTQKDGTEIPMSPMMMNISLGLNKYTSIYGQKKLEQMAVKSEALYKQNKARVEAIKAETELKKQQLDIYKTKKELEQYSSSEKANINKINKINEVVAPIVDNPLASEEDVKPLVDKVMSNKTYTDSLVKNQNSIYRKVNQLQYFRDKIGSLSKEMNKLVDGVKTGTLETVNKMLLRFTGHGLNKDEYLKAQDLSTRLNLAIMDYLQYKSGAAFGKEELEGYQKAGGILDFNSPELAKVSLQGMAKYLASKLKMNINQVPTAVDRMVLKYKAGLYPPKHIAGIAKELQSLPDDKARVEKLKTLDSKDFKQFEEYYGN